MTDPNALFADMPTDAEELNRWLLSNKRLDILRERIAISEIVACTVRLESAPHGEMRGPCPHPEHDDDQNAFFVNDRKGVFHCFGCGLHGDVIRWMTDYENLGFVEAVRILIKKINSMQQPQS